MTLFEKIANFLSESGIDYQLLTHAPVYTSEQAATARADVSLHQGAKAMVLKISRRFGSDVPVRNADRHRDPDFTSGQNEEETISADPSTPFRVGYKLPTTDYVMCVLPGDRKIDFKKLKLVLGARDATLADPIEVEKIVGVKIGAVSPFGNLSGLRVYLDDSITDNEEIVFNAGDHSKSVKMRLADFLVIVRPEVMSFSKDYENS